MTTPATVDVVVREEREGDAAAVRLVNETAFGSPVEANLVDRLRDRGQLQISLVAEDGDRIVGHIAFSPVSFEPPSGAARGVGLGPMAVTRALQRRGIGSILVRDGLERCRELGVDYVVVLGHPDYHPHLGFAPASRFGLRCEWDVPDEVFMALELRADALRGISGTARYRPEFNDV